MNTMTLWHLSGWSSPPWPARLCLVGFSKTAVSGANTVSLAIFAAVLPARASTGVLAAPADRRRRARRPHLPAARALAHAVAAVPGRGGGVVAGTLFLVWADDGIVRTSIGAILLLMAGVTVWRRRTAGTPREPEEVATRAGRAKGPARTACSAGSRRWSPTRAGR